MPSYLSGSRIKKPEFRRSSSSPFSQAQRTKSAHKTHAVSAALNKAYGSEDEAEEDELLVHSAKIISVLTNDAAKDVPSAMEHAASSMFEEIPDRAGMNSTRIAEVLNFQKGLPKVISLAHVHALISASSRTEREIQTLLSSNRVRKLKVVGRGTDVSGMSEVLISMDDYQSLLRNSGLSEETIAAFREVLLQNPRATGLPPSALSRTHSTALAKAGFIVSSSISGGGSVSGGNSVHENVASIVARGTVSRAASGSQGAVGGDSAFERLGGINGARRTSSDPLFSHLSSSTGELNPSVPNIGPYLRLVSLARTHLLDLLRRSSKHRQAPLYLLRERWDGNIDSDEKRVSTAKRVRGEFSNVLPAKTKKWKDLNGLRFDWVVEECLGAGMIELFETRAVGLGVRALT